MRRALGWRLSVFLILGFLLLCRADGAEALRRIQTARFVVETREDGPRNLDFHARLCEQALTRLAPWFAASLSPSEKIRVWVSPDREDFTRRSRLSAHTVLAVAFPGDDRIVLNDDGLRCAGAAQRIETVAHEMAHLLIGRAAGDVWVPYWLHEGLAQEVSSMDLEGGAMRLAWASITGRFIPIRSLIRRFPYGGPAAPLAYAESADFTRFVATEGLAFQNTRDFFEFLIERPVEARRVFRNLSDPTVVDGLERRWHEKVRGPVNWLLALTGSGVLWILVVVLFLAAYWRKKLREREVMEQWDPWERDSDSHVE